MERADYRHFILREFESRVRRNPRYSLRSFARDINLPAPKLSQILKRTCGLSRERAIVVAKRLNFGDDETEYFSLLVEAEHGRGVARKEGARKQLDDLLQLRAIQDSFQTMSLARFSVVRDWQHFAILELTETKDFRPDPSWIAARLGLPEATITESLKRLMSCGLLVVHPEKGLAQTAVNLSTPFETPSRDVREHHIQVFGKAQWALETVPALEREISASMMAIDSAKMPEMKKWIRDFRRRFMVDAQSGGGKDRVYCLAIQFFPLDQKS
jgi:uncharacterized protein (TIGR02147 family)